MAPATSSAWNLYTMLLISTLILATLLGVKGQCTLTEYPRENGICSANVTCIRTTENLMQSVKKNWSCIKRRVQYYYNNENDYRYDNDYNLNVYVGSIDIGISEDYVTGITDVKSNLKSLIITNGNLVSVGFTLTGFRKLIDFSVTYHKLETINFNRLLTDSLRTVNISHNCIATIEFGVSESTVSSVVTNIDLSYNALEVIPNNCFAMFVRLKYLDLSFNKISKFDILTFEGITQLEILKLSNNRILELGQNFARFMKLKYLSLDNNQLTALTDVNFRTLISLERLNLSSNMIKHIEDQSLSTLSNLIELDLSHNKINVIRKTLLKNNTNICALLLSHNDIEIIESGAFSTANISNFDIKNNYISGSIDYDTLLGISVQSLDLSNGTIKHLGDKAFKALSDNLMYLNLSNNVIENITETAFISLQILSKLDLSNNNLIDIEFNTSDLTQLKEYYLQNNLIKKITLNMFRNMKSLVKLDLSKNNIRDIELNSFIELTNLKELNISSNYFVKSLTSNIFKGLSRVITLDLSNTRSMSCLNESFSGMISLVHLNLSHSQLESIEYEIFKETGSIQNIDLSYNNLEIFAINTSYIPLLLELRINHNKLKNITSETFKNLHLLEKLYLAYNDILYVDSMGLKSLSHLHYLDLFSNVNMRIKGDVFNNLDISTVYLKNVKRKFNFDNVVNSSITTLVISNCEIDNINSVFVYKIKDIHKLDVSHNKIKVLNKGSFLNMDTLHWLDISYNIISSIQPGTFLSNKMINTLNLYGNNLESLQFGVLDGLTNLRVLNLSNNEIHVFGINLLHSTPYLRELFLENNNLESMDFRELNNTSVELLTIGGNSISCDALVDWNKVNDDSLNVTAGRPNFNSENIHGISCKGRKELLRNENQNDNNSNVNVTSEVIQIKDIIEKLSGYLRISLNGTISNIIAVLNNIPDKNNTDKAVEVLNRPQIVFNEQIKQLLMENKNTSDNLANDIKLMISLLEINNNLTKLGNVQKDSPYIPILDKPIINNDDRNLTDYITNMYVESKKGQLDKSTLADMKLLLYFIAMCFTIVILFRAVALAYKCVYGKGRRIGISHPYDSGQQISNGLEME